MLVMVSEGMTVKQIAARSYVSLHTVRKQCAAIREKLGVHTMAGAVMVGARRGILR